MSNQKQHITTALTTDKGTITHEGTSGFTVTGVRSGDEMDTLIEYSSLAKDELREMVCCLLCLLDEKAGEKFVTSCFARYAEEMKKEFFTEGNGRKLVILRGGE